MKNESTQLVRNGLKLWWVSLITGLLSILLGIWCTITADKSLSSLINVFIFFFVVCGILEIFFAISNRRNLNFLGKIRGVIDMLCALLLLFFPSYTTPIIASCWILIRSLLAISDTLKLKNLELKSNGLLIFAGLSCVASILFFLATFFFSQSFMIVVSAISFFAYGIFKVSFSFKLSSISYIEHIPEEN